MPAMPFFSIGVLSHAQWLNTDRSSTEHFGVELREFVEAIGEREDLGRTDEREIQRIEKEDEPFAM